MIAAVSTAIEAWQFSLAGRFRLLEQWCTFVQRHQRHAISEDTWLQLLEFSQRFNDDLCNYDPEGAWPVLVDDFVDSLNRKPVSDVDRTSHCNGESDMLGNCSFDYVNSAQSLESFTAREVATPIRSKRHRSENQSEVSDLEPVNCIAQGLAEMSSPLSYKRLCTAQLEAEEGMEGIVNTAAGKDMYCEAMDASIEVGPSGCLGQAPSQVWPIHLEDGKQALLPNLVCTGYCSASCGYDLKDGSCRHTKE